MMDNNTDFLSAAFAELDMNRAALTCLIECFGVEMVPERIVLTENMLYLLEGGLDRVSALLEQEAQYRLEVKA